MKIRHIEMEDAQSFARLLLQVDEESEFMLFEGGERTMDVSSAETRIKTVKSENNSTIIVAEDQGKLVGYLMAMGGQARRNRHSAYLVVGLLKDYRGQGLGTRMFQKLEEWSREKNIHRLELTVISKNKAGVALYKKMGFEMEGVKKDSLYINGEYVDEYYMGKLL
ncbi:MAG: GNAT family N-acetyltransferase [Bacillaceae bacterium]|nr:GNAT family N-acetyltransferase [Bacillaceae bacterium]